ncbi:MULTISPECIES: anhydro-N-acetylmuramic acid kinase [unclassified Aureispira]|uniref:anhydro-N-acetylmuramic acid kinase n=1 Tax=unclassified Aureispira TaxID=2649989 RepID=UPI000696531D|nr:MULTISPECIES: anhydro-N-acetylmuramic acid kinase [unclassified Aureispira]WMX15431.1 anhydro-N-acetylmuramic acid kinase [Aureispira sp. CCB-E]
MNYKVLGLMSGSSLDGLDIAYCSINWENQQVKEWELLASETLDFSDMWKSRLRNLPSQDGLIFAKTHTYFGHYMAELVQTFIQKHHLSNIDFIASHGHTIFHNPNQRISIQIGDGAALAAKTGITTICDFRTQDVALDGEGAPLAPLADQYLFKGYDFYLNIGGIANLSANINNKWVAMDCCPANQVLNALAQELGAEYDDKGIWSSQGIVAQGLLEQVANFDYYTQSYPKSLGNAWIRQQVLPLYLAASFSWQDKLATACEHIAIEIATCIEQVLQKEAFSKQNYKVLVTGGGAFNEFLMERINAYCNRHAEVELFLPDASIISFKEAILMALLGVMRIEKTSNSLKSITGARRNTINGAIYQGLL